MGSGKTTVGKVLASLLHFKFIDLDDKIEEWWGRSIPEIFDENGETTFRDYERIALHLIRHYHYHIIATGGGIIEDPAQMTRMKSMGWIVYLHTPFSCIKKRLTRSGHHRPIWRDYFMARYRYRKRLPLYAQHATLTVDASRPPKEIAQLIHTSLKEDIRCSMRF